MPRTTRLNVHFDNVMPALEAHGLVGTCATTTHHRGHAAPEAPPAAHARAHRAAPGRRAHLYSQTDLHIHRKKSEAQFCELIVALELTRCTSQCSHLTRFYVNPTEEDRNGDPLKQGKWAQQVNLSTEPPPARGFLTRLSV